MQVSVPEFQLPPIAGHVVEPFEVLISVVVEARASGTATAKSKKTSPAATTSGGALAARLLTGYCPRGGYLLGAKAGFMRMIFKFTNIDHDRDGPIGIITREGVHEGDNQP